MSLTNKLKDGLIKYLNNCDRSVRRMFNEYLDKYPYIVFCPNEKEPIVAFCIGFMKDTFFTKPKDVFGLVITDDNDNNVFYLYSSYAQFTEEALYIESKDFPKFYLEPAPFSLIENASNLGAADISKLSYAVQDYLNCDNLPYDADTIIEKFISSISDIEHYNVFVDYRTNSLSSYGECVSAVKYKGEVLGVIYTRGYDNSRLKIYVTNEKKWCELMQYIIDNSGVKQYIRKGYKVIDMSKDCDIYFPVPGISKHLYEAKK